MADSSESWHRDVNIRREERELVLVYIGSSSCGPCNDPEFKNVLSQFKLALANLAQSEHRKLRTIGVSKDWDVDVGLQFLRETGPWNEVVVGNNWYNSAVIEHVWNDPTAKGAIPQVIVLERSFLFSEHRYIPGPKQYLMRLVGKHAIAEWLKAEAGLGGQA